MKGATHIISFLLFRFLIYIPTVSNAEESTFDVDYDPRDITSGPLLEPCTLLIKATMYTVDNSKDTLCLSCELSPSDAERLSQRVVDIGCKSTGTNHASISGGVQRRTEQEMPKLLADPFFEGKIKSGEDLLHATGAIISNFKMSFPQDMLSTTRSMNDFYIEHRLHVNKPTKFKVRRPPSNNVSYQREEDAGRRLVKAERRAVIVAGDFLDTKTTLSRKDLSDKVFGTNGDPVNLKSQMKACSFDQVNIVPATTSTKGVNLPLGVLRLNVDQRVVGLMEFHDVYEILYQEAEEKLGNLHQYDHVMFVLPPGFGDWGAIGYYNWHSTAFNDDNIKYVSYLMHEIGHNLNLDHAGDPNKDAENGIDSYGDQSSYMGYSYAEDNEPRMCYNAPAYVQLRWFPDQEVALKREDCTWSGNLYAVANFNTDRDNKMLIYITSDSFPHIYVSYNLAVGSNIDSLMGVNQVLIHSKPIGGLYDAGESILIATLSAGETFIVSDDGPSTIQITFESSGSKFARITIVEDNDVDLDPPFSPPSPTPPSPSPPSSTEIEDCNKLSEKKCEASFQCTFHESTKLCFHDCSVMNREQCGELKQCGWWHKPDKCGFKKCSDRTSLGRNKCQKFDHCHWKWFKKVCTANCYLQKTRKKCRTIPDCQWNENDKECVVKGT